MNYIELINSFWKCNKEHSFDPSSVCVYFYLVHTCNSLHWKNPFRHSDRHMAINLGMSVNTVRNAKNKLKQRGLIDFKAGNSKGGRSFESLTEYKLNVSNFDTYYEANIDNVSNFDMYPDTLSDTYSDTYSDTLSAINNKLNINNIYITREGKKITELEFLDIWSKARMHYEKKPTNISKLDAIEKQSFKQLSEVYSKKAFEYSVAGLFFQDTFQAVRTRPKWLLELKNFETMLDCWVNKTKIFDKSPKIDDKSKFKKGDV